ncbi:MAG: aldo/keto reductase [Lentisphaerota bacterium]|jgi:L-glyceraldehyde 3-phosphate reductase
MNYEPDPKRYESGMIYNRCGRSGLRLPAVSLGLWHNFGQAASSASCREILTTAFDLGVTHFDLANNYGPPAGAAETQLGALLKNTFGVWRDELVIATKAGYFMWPGPYGEWGSRKGLLASLDQSLKRLGLDYVDIFYHHRPDPDTPLEESMGALDTAVRQGKALYVGLSNYPAELARRAARILRQMGTPCVIHQPRYSMLERGVEDGLLATAAEEGIGVIAFSPLAQGVLTNKYAAGVPADSRVGKGSPFLTAARLTPAAVDTARRLAPIATDRGQSLAQMALAWVLRDTRVTSVLIGASSADQVRENIGALRNTLFSEDELAEIEAVLADA